MTIPQQCFELIEEFEGFKTNAYPDPATHGDPWTIGIGTTVYPNGQKVKKGDTCTHTQALEWLEHDCAKFATFVPEGNPNQFSAMVSLCYNIGPGNFNKSSVRRLHVAHDYVGAAKSFLLWNKAGKPPKVMAGLTRRREAEKKLYLTP